MSTTRKTVSGDTFESVARKQYGTELEAQRVAMANPGLQEPLPVGVDIILPIIQAAPQDIPQSAPFSDPNEVALSIDGSRFRFWESIRISRSMDSMDTIELSAPFEASAPGFKEIFSPFGYKPTSVTVGGKPLFSGTIVPIDPDIKPKRKAIAVGGYSLPGVLNDCTPPASFFEKLESNELGLKDIAQAVCEPFGLQVEFRDGADPGPIFDRVAFKPTKKALSVLINLANQRNLIISNTPLGSLSFLKSVEAGNPVARLRQGEAPLLSVTPNLKPQEYYSHITGVSPTWIGLDGDQYTAKNPHLNGVIRPFTFQAQDTDESNMKQAVDAKMGRMFGNVVGYSVSVPTWRDPNGNLWETNTTMTLIAADAMIYKEYEFLIRSIDFDRDRASELATLNLVVPGSFSGKIPERLPWDL